MDPRPDHDCATAIAAFGAPCVKCAAAKPSVEPGTIPLGRVACQLCTLEVDPQDRRTWRLVAGWAKDRRQGGTNALALRQDLHRYAHGDCVKAAKAGHLHQQPLALDPPD